MSEIVDDNSANGFSGTWVLLAALARRVSGRAAQCAVTVAVAFVSVTLVGCAIVREAFEGIAAKQAVLQEIGVAPWVPAAHFLERTFTQNLTAGAFFGVTVGIAMGIGIFFLCLLCESLPYRKMRIAALSVCAVSLAVLSSSIFRLEGIATVCFVWVLPVVTAAVCEMLSPTAVWGTWDNSAGPGYLDARRVPKRVFLALVAINACTVLALALWALRCLPVLSISPPDKDFFVFFRDDFLLEFRAGRALNRFYYRNSPYASEYAPPTQFQPVCVAAAGLDPEAVKFIPRFYGGARIPVYTVPMADLDTALKRFSAGNFDVLVIEPGACGMTASGVEEKMLARKDLPSNWDLRTILITDGERKGFPVWTQKTRGRISKAVWRATDNGFATGPSSAVREMIQLTFLLPLQSLFRTSALAALVLVLVLWASILAVSCRARHGAWRVVSIALSVLLAMGGLWLFVAGPPDRDLARTLGDLYTPGTADIDCGAMLENPSASTRYAVLRYLVDKPDPRRVKRALELFSDPEPRVRMRAVEFVGVLMSRTSTRRRADLRNLRDEISRGILAALGDESLHVRCRAADAIAAMKLREAEEGLVKLIEENRDLYVTWSALKALRRLNPSRRGKT